MTTGDAWLTGCRRATSRATFDTVAARISSAIRASSTAYCVKIGRSPSDGRSLIAPAGGACGPLAGPLWTVDEARQFLETARNDEDPLYAAYVLILVLGLRRGEVLGLRWQDVDFDGHELSVSYQLQRVRRQLLHRETKTEASDATLPLPAICRAALIQRRTEQDRTRTAAEVRLPSDMVFTTDHGTPFDPRNFHRQFKKRSARAGVRLISVHTTRRTCASLLVALDVHPRVAMTILRHSQIAVTMNIYSEAPSKATQKAVKRLGKKLDI